MATPPTIEPQSFLQGTTVVWTKAVPDRVPADGWTLTYYFGAAASEKTVVCTDNGDGTFLATIPATTSDDYTAGPYTWQAISSKAGEAFLEGTGTTNVIPKIAGSGGVDLRSQAVKNLAALEAVIFGRCSQSDLSYSIAGRSLSKMSHAELIAARTFWKNEIAKEERAEKAANGRGGMLVRQRFTR